MSRESPCLPAAPQQPSAPKMAHFAPLFSNDTAAAAADAAAADEEILIPADSWGSAPSLATSIKSTASEWARIAALGIKDEYPEIINEFEPQLELMHVYVDDDDEAFRPATDTKQTN